VKRIRLAPRALAATAAAFALALAACGGDDDGSGGERPDSGAGPRGADLGAIKSYLLAHTERLVDDASRIRAGAEDLHALAARTEFDYGRLLDEHRATLDRLVRDAQRNFARANPSYEEMEGVVAGVPSLADYDVIIDAGGDASDPETAVPFDLETPAGRTLEQPGNLNFLIETTAFGTEPRFQAKDVQPDLDGDGRVEFGESIPDADFYVAAARAFERYAKELDAAAREWQPTPSDVLTALVVMTPTMSEYFEAWKNSRFVAGAEATETAFVAASRLQDIADILGGLVLVYDNVRPLVARADRQQARQTEQALRTLRNFAAELERKEAAGRTFTAEEADTLGSQAQERAEAIAGQITQAAAKLDVEIDEG
jgi:Imelysin